MHVEAVERFLASVVVPDAAAPLVAAVKGLAELLDLDGADASVWREYRFMLKELREAVAGGSSAGLEEEFGNLG